jgi:hypothetical protein
MGERIETDEFTTKRTKMREGRWSSCSFVHFVAPSVARQLSARRLLAATAGVQPDCIML